MAGWQWSLKSECVGAVIDPAKLSIDRFKTGQFWGGRRAAKWARKVNSGSEIRGQKRVRDEKFLCFVFPFHFFSSKSRKGARSSFRPRGSCDLVFAKQFSCTLPSLTLSLQTIACISNISAITRPTQFLPSIITPSREEWVDFSGADKKGLACKIIGAFSRRQKFPCMSVKTGLFCDKCQAVLFTWVTWVQQKYLNQGHLSATFFQVILWIKGCDGLAQIIEFVHA